MKRISKHSFPPEFPYRFLFGRKGGVRIWDVFLSSHFFGFGAEPLPTLPHIFPWSLCNYAWSLFRPVSELRCALEDPKPGGHREKGSLPELPESLHDQAAPLRCPVRKPKPAAQDDFDDFDDGYDDFEEPRRPAARRPSEPPRSRRNEPPRSRRGAARGSRGGKKPRRKSGSGNGAKIALLAGGGVLGLLLVVGLGVLVYNLVGGGGLNTKDMAWLSPNTQVVVSVDVDEVWNSNVVQRILNNQNAAQLKTGLDELQKKMEQGGFNQGESIDSVESFLAGYEDPDKMDRGPHLMVVRKKTPWNVDGLKTGENLSEATHNDKTFYDGGRLAFYLPDEKTLLVGPTDSVKQALDRGATSNVAEKFSFLPSGQIVAGYLPDDPAKLTREIKPPPMLPGKEYVADMMEGAKDLKGGAWVLNLSSGIEFKVVGKCGSSDSAAKISGGIQQALAEGRKYINDNRAKMNEAPPEMQEGIALAESVFNSISASQSGEHVTLSAEVPSSVIDKMEQLANNNQNSMLKNFGRGFNIPSFPFGRGNRPSLFGQGNRPNPVGPGGLGNPFTEAREAARRAASKNNLRQVGVAMHNFYDTYHALPVPKNQTELSSQLSWRVHILPFLGQQALYQQFHKNEPWNSAHNLRLVNQMPAIYKSPNSNAPPGRTVYLGIDGPGGVMENGGGKKFAELVDGMSNTILVVEADDAAAVVWTKPDDYRYNPANPTQNLGETSGGFNALLCDGSVRYLAKNINPQTLLDLFQYNDGHPIGNF